MTTHSHILAQHTNNCSEASTPTFITPSACMHFPRARTLPSSVCYYSICSLIITNEHTHSVGSAFKLVEAITAAKLFWLDPWFPTTSHQSQRSLAPYSALIKWFDFTLCFPPSDTISQTVCFSVPDETTHFISIQNYNTRMERSEELRIPQQQDRDFSWRKC